MNPLLKKSAAHTDAYARSKRERDQAQEGQQEAQEAQDALHQRRHAAGDNE